MSESPTRKEQEADDEEARKAHERRQRAWLQQVRTFRRSGAGSSRTQNPGLSLAVKRSNRRVMRVSVAQSLPRVVEQDAGLGQELLHRLARTSRLPPRPGNPGDPPSGGSMADSLASLRSLKPLQASRSAPQLGGVPAKRGAQQASRRLRPAPSAPGLAPLRAPGPSRLSRPDSGPSLPRVHGKADRATPQDRRPTRGETAASARRVDLGQSLLAIERGTTGDKVAREQAEERSVAMKAFEQPLKLHAVPKKVKLKFGAAAVLQHELSGRYLTCLPSGGVALSPSPVAGSLLHVRSAPRRPPFRPSPPPRQLTSHPPQVINARDIFSDKPVAIGTDLWFQAPGGCLPAHLASSVLAASLSRQRSESKPEKDRSSLTTSLASTVADPVHPLALVGFDEEAAERAARAFGSRRRGDPASGMVRGEEDSQHRPSSDFLRLLLLGRWELQRAPPPRRRRGPDAQAGTSDPDGAGALAEVDELDEETRRADPLVCSGDRVRLAQDGKFLQGRRWPGGPSPWAALAGIDASGRSSSGDTWRIHLVPSVGAGAGVAGGGNTRPAAQRGASTMAKATEHLARVREAAEQSELMPYRIFSERQQYREVRRPTPFLPPRCHVSTV